MTIPVTCPHCGHNTQVSEEFVGQSGPCAKCGQTFTVPPPAGSPSYAPSGKRSSGWAMIAIIVIVFVGMIVLCLGALGVFFYRATGEFQVTMEEAANEAMAGAQISLVEASLQMYTLDVGSPPTTGQGLDALLAPAADLQDPSVWQGPYINGAVPLDPWGQPYLYEYPGVYSTDSFDVWSVGPDGMDGTADDIGNWQP